MSPYKQVNYDTETIEQVLEETVVAAIPQRGLSEATCTHFGIRTAYDQNDGAPAAHYFPVFRGKNITGFIKRDLRKPKKKAWSVIGEVSVKDGLFGQHACRPSRKLWITEGMYDAPSVWQSLNENQKIPGKYTPNVVSITLGTKNAVANLAHNTAFLGRYDEKILCFDNDVATPEQLAKGDLLGQDAAKNVCLAWPGYKNAVLPEEVQENPIKDANDLLLVDSYELYREVMFNASDFTHEAVVAGASISTDELMKSVGSGFMVNDLPETMRLLHGLRPGELTIVLAPPKCGKTTLCRLINYRLIEAGIPTLGIYLEEDYKKTVQAFTALEHKVPLPRLRENPALLTREQYEHTKSGLLRPEVAYFYDGRRRKMTPQDVIDTLLWAASVGIRYAILDHLSYVFSGQSSTNERKDIDLLLTEIADVVRTTGIHPIVVSHIARKMKTPATNKQGEVQYPWWYTVDITDARGSGAFEQITWNMIAVEKQVTEDGSRGFSRTNVLLNREWDWTGTGDTLTVDAGTGWMKTVPKTL